MFFLRDYKTPSISNKHAQCPINKSKKTRKVDFKSLRQPMETEKIGKIKEPIVD